MSSAIKAFRSNPLQRPRTTIVLSFLLWKLFLLLIAISSPGPGYDTSAYLKQPHNEGLLGNWLRKFVRWDAVYYTKIAQRGYMFEQEWAFGWGFTRLLGYIGRSLQSTYLLASGDAMTLAGIVVAHISHALSILVLYEMSRKVFQSNPRATQIALVSASLHIISPAGLFLSAPYAESPYALLQMCGYYCYLDARLDTASGLSLTRELKVITSGILLGLATTFRGNGLLNGILFAYDTVEYGLQLNWTPGNLAILWKLVSIIIAGLCTALGTVVPQYLAYQEYCSGRKTGEDRPWCSRTIPSIYAFVQAEYWNVGFLRYWTISNIPLFLLATPMLFFLVRSCIWAWEETTSYSETKIETIEGIESNNVIHPVDSLCQQRQKVLRVLSLPQFALAIMALTGYHVQIITRLSSAYPVWCWWLATSIVSGSPERRFDRNFTKPSIVSRWMIMYAVIQGGLFASFLPPA